MQNMAKRSVIEDSDDEDELEDTPLEGEHDCVNLDYSPPSIAPSASTTHSMTSTGKATSSAG